MKLRKILFGPPGTGKTTALIRLVEEYINRGTDPARIGFVSFSRRAIQEAKEAAAAVTDKPLPHFRTIHSMAYHLLDLSQGDVLQLEHMKDLGGLIGIPFKHTPGQSDDLWEGGLGDRMLALHHLACARNTDLETEWRRARIPDLSWPMLRRTVDLYKQYKDRGALWDFDDMIARAEGTLGLDVLFVDEAQDTSAAQWALLRRVASHVEHVYFAGDDDQAIYQWGGADPGQLLRFNGERVVLPQSYRLPRRVKAVADRVAAGIRHRVPKDFAAREEDGFCATVPEAGMVDLHWQGTWLLLCRTNSQRRELETLARQQGVVYQMSNRRWSWEYPSVVAAVTYEALRKGKSVPRSSVKTMLGFAVGHRPLQGGAELAWEDVYTSTVSKSLNWMEALMMSDYEREYIRALRRHNEPLNQPGRVRIGTVHSFKGAEADRVLVVPDLTGTIEQGRMVDPDAELRVQYVAVTRARHSLIVVQPNSQYHWRF